MKSIGFIDFYISEWHANNYPQWIKDASAKLGVDYEVKFAWAEQDISPVDGVSTDEWCAKMGVTRCASIAELCEKSDVIMILSPSNPEKHLQYAQEALKCGKRTQIDKTFAPDYDTAKKIFDIAEQYNTPFFSTSALRYADELKDFADIKNMIVTGGGGNFAEYIIHTVEMVVTLFDSAAKKVKVKNIGGQRVCRIVTENSAQAVILFSPEMGFGITAENRNGEFIHRDMASDFFANLISDIIKFYEDGVMPFDSKQTMEVMRIRTGLLEAEKADGKWIEL